MGLMSGKRQKNQLQLAFEAESRSEAPRIANEGTETLKANCDPESPAISENLKEAWKRVKANQGSAGVDGISVQQLPRHLIKHWPIIREQLLNGTYKPQPVRRVEIPKPDGGGVRKLGIPTVLDRF